MPANRSEDFIIYGERDLLHLHRYMYDCATQSTGRARQIRGAACRKTWVAIRSSSTFRVDAHGIANVTPGSERQPNFPETLISS
jgi:hypothetical protein